MEKQRTTIRERVTQAEASWLACVSKCSLCQHMILVGGQYSTASPVSCLATTLLIFCFLVRVTTDLATLSNPSLGQSTRCTAPKDRQLAMGNRPQWPPKSSSRSGVGIPEVPACYLTIDRLTDQAKPGSTYVHQDQLPRESVISVVQQANQPTQVQYRGIMQAEVAGRQARLSTRPPLSMVYSIRVSHLLNNLHPRAEGIA